MEEEIAGTEESPGDVRFVVYEFASESSVV
jgi:hypothetical protein